MDSGGRPLLWAVWKNSADRVGSTAAIGTVSVPLAELTAVPVWTDEMTAARAVVARPSESRTGSQTASGRRARPPACFFDGTTERSPLRTLVFPTATLPIGD
jgi:hypothetical protein